MVVCQSFCISKNFGTFHLFSDHFPVLPPPSHSISLFFAYLKQIHYFCVNIKSPQTFIKLQNWLI